MTPGAETGHAGGKSEENFEIGVVPDGPLGRFGAALLYPGDFRVVALPRPPDYDTLFHTTIVPDTAFAPSVQMVRGVRNLAIPVSLAIFAAAANPAPSLTSAHSKYLAIAHGLPRPGARIVFGTAELNEWMAEEAGFWGPKGVRNLRFRPGDGVATGYADVDFLRLRKAATGEDPGWVMRNLFAGERPVQVTARIQSAGGRARVDLERVEISGVAIDGPALDFVIRNYLKPTFPGAKVGEWFELDFRVERVAVTPSGATVFIRRIE